MSTMKKAKQLRYCRRHLRGGLGKLQHETEHGISVIPEGDRIFMDKALSILGVRGIRFAYSDSKARHPDIWIDLDSPVPIITVTREWRRQNYHERRKRLVHEILHLRGEKHGRKVGGLVYSTYPRLDTYSKAIYEEIVKRC